jgi:hypothetical protein
MNTRRKNAQETLHTARPLLELTTPTTWEYRLTPDGFETLIHVDLPDKRITIGHTMPWDVFIAGLSRGWYDFHQNNPEFTQQINDFIVRQIEQGNYVPIAEQGEKHE